ncbi:hypothetical protein PsalSR1_04214 (plasmid) [Piscirickettsia salmonis]|nr:hypothetical protein PsalSR1_04214 [Piscirickettsia salmonis]
MNAALGFKSVQGAKATIAGVELYRMLKKNRCTATMIRQHTSNFTCSQLNCVQRKVFLPVNLKLRQNRQPRFTKSITNEQFSCENHPTI